MHRLAGRVALVTGAAGGLGSQIARVLAREGAQVALNYIDIEDAAAIAAKLAEDLEYEYGNPCRAYVADITEEAQVIAMVEQITGDLGKTDILVNNAGISYNASSWKFPAQAWDKVLKVNLTGAFYCAKAVLPAMRERRHGRIVNISSAVALSGVMGTSAYAASRAGLIGLSKTMARETAEYGITVNCIAPGYIDAGLISDVPDKYRQENLIPTIPMRKLGQAEDIANAVLFLASEQSGYITGEVLRVDGGFAM